MSRIQEFAEDLVAMSCTEVSRMNKIMKAVYCDGKNTSSHKTSDACKRNKIKKRRNKKKRK